MPVIQRRKFSVARGVVLVACTSVHVMANLLYCLTRLDLA